MLIDIGEELGLNPILDIGFRHVSMGRNCAHFFCNGGENSRFNEPNMRVKCLIVTRKYWFYDKKSENKIKQTYWLQDSRILGRLTDCFRRELSFEAEDSPRLSGVVWSTAETLLSPPRLMVPSGTRLKLKIRNIQNIFFCFI